MIHVARLYEYIVRRALTFIPLIIIITLLVFTLTHIAPGDPMSYMFGQAQMGEMEAELRRIYTEKWGLDKPIWEQYLIWLWNTIRGDLGYSFHIGRPVAELVFERIPKTVELAVASLVLGWALSIPLGVISAVRKDSILDRLVTSFSVAANSMPTFWIGIVMIIIFALYLGWFPTSGAGLDMGIVEHLRSLVLPTIVLGLSRLGMLTRLTRNSVLEVLNEDYVLTARAKGLKEHVVVYKHALRNALLPVVTILGLELAFVLSGAVLVETVFAWPGMGQFFVISAHRRDYPTLMGINFMACLTILIAMLVTDVSYALLDPRIRY